MLRLPLFWLLFVLPLMLQGQQAIPFTVFPMNPLQYNPAYAGLGGSLVMVAGYRRQWSQLQDSPQSQYLSVHMPVTLLGGGVGMQVSSDRLGAVRQTAIALSYSLHQPLGWGILTAGVSGGVVQRSLDGLLLRTPTGVYEPGVIPIHNDNLLPAGMESGWLPVVHAGVYLMTDRFELGIGIQNLIEYQLSLPTMRYQLDRSFHLQGNYQVELSRNLVFRPAMMLRTDLVHVQTDISLLMQVQGNITVGVSLRGYSADTGDAVAGIFGFKLSDNMTLSYAYDITLSGLRRVSNGSHELVLGYNLNRPVGQGRMPPIIFNPRTL
jgi:type IX secretion system PorP/SprF family membrane protein